MKANKALKRLTKIEALISQAASRTTKTAKAPAKQKRRLSAAGRKAIQEATRRRWAQKRATTANANRAAKKAAPARKKTAVEKAAVRTPAAKTTKKSAPLKKLVTKAAAKKTVQAPVKRTPVSAPTPVTVPALAPVQAATEPVAPGANRQSI